MMVIIMEIDKEIKTVLTATTKGDTGGSPWAVTVSTIFP